MVGTGKPRKPFYVNTAVESTFRTEGTSQRALSGSIKEAPSFDPHFNPIGVPRHSELGTNYKVLKGKFEGAFNYNMSIEDFRPFAHIFGGRIDQIRAIDYTLTSGTFLADEVVDDDSTTAKAAISSVTATRLTLKIFVQDEVVTFSGGGTGKVYKQHGNILTLHTITGTPAADEEMTGGTSGAKAMPSAVAAADSFGRRAITLYAFGDGNTISNTGGSTAAGTQGDNIYNHYLFVSNSPEAESLFYNYESLVNQHNMLGSVLNTLELTSAVNEAPSQALQWLVSERVKDATKDDEVLLSASAGAVIPYQYTAFALTANSIVYDALFRALTVTFGRDYESSDAHSELYAVGQTTSSFSSTVKATIFKEDEVLLDLSDNDTRFPIVITMARGTSGIDDAVLTFGNAKMLKPSEGGDKKITLEIPFEIEGTPTMSINDLIDNYD